MGPDRTGPGGGTPIPPDRSAPGARGGRAHPEQDANRAAVARDGRPVRVPPVDRAGRGGGAWQVIMDLLSDQETPSVPLARPLPPVRVEGRIDPRLFVGADATPSETVPVGTVRAGAIPFRMDLAA